MSEPHDRTNQLGVCGEKAAANLSSKQKLERLIKFSAQNRLHEKTKKLVAGLEEASYLGLEQRLYELVFEAYGLYRNRGLFLDAAKAFPYQELLPLLKTPAGSQKILQQWTIFFGLELYPLSLAKVFNSEQLQVLGENQAGSVRASSALSFQERVHPLFRLVGLLQHLIATQQKGLLRSWLNAIRACCPSLEVVSKKATTPADSHASMQDVDQEAVLNPVLHQAFQARNFSWLLADEPAKTADGRSKIGQLFAHPSSSGQAFQPLRSLQALPYQPKLEFAGLEKLFESDQNFCLYPAKTGQERITILLVNAILPFFRIYARLMQDSALSSCLFKLYWSYPKSKENNQKVRFMEDRFGKLDLSPRLKKSLAYRQGLIQCRDHFCQSFEQGCQDCALLRWL